MKKIFLIILSLNYFNPVLGQFSAIQDGEGETSFQLLTANTIVINAQETSIGFSVMPKEYKNEQNLTYWAITSTANAKKGTSNIFKGGEFQFSGKLGTNVIFDKTDYPDRNEVRDINLVYNFVGLELLYSRHNTFNSDKPFEEQIYNESNFGFRINYGWNFLNVGIDKPMFNLLGEFTTGISGSFGIKDNTDIIDQVEIITSTQSFVNGNSVRTVSTTSDVYDINSLSTNNFFGRINFDFAKHILNNRILANLHFTYAMDEDLSSVLNPAIGIFVIQKGQPLEATVGLQLQTSDWSNSRDSEKNRWERSALVLIAGFPFN